MRKKLYLIQPTYRDRNGRLLKGTRLYTVSLALSALSAIVPPGWEKQTCFEYFDEIDFDSDASVIAISCMGYEIFRGIEIADEFRKRGKTIIFGGFQARLSTTHLAPHCDAIIYGNPGISDMARILLDAEQHSLRPVYECGVDLDYRLDYSILDPHRLVFTPVLLGVGCRNACDFCCVGSLYQGRYATRNLATVLAELTELERTTSRLAVIDTNCYNDREYLRELCRAMIQRKFHFFWGAQCTIDIGDDAETLTLLRKAGCRVLFIGMESIDQSNLDAVRKRHRADSYPRRIQTIHRAGIRIAAFFIYGFDYDTTDTARALSQFIADHHIALPMINVLVPLPGTRIFEQLKTQDRLLSAEPNDFLKNNPAYNSSFNLCLYTPKHMSPRQVEEGFVELLGRLAGWPQTIRRSLGGGLSLSAFFLYMNWQFRREYFELRKRIDLQRRVQAPS